MSNTLMGLDEFHGLHRNLSENEVILDVRRPDEFSEGHIPRALNIPVDQVSTKADELKKYKKVYIHCKRGGRAKTAYESLSSLGLTNLVCVHDAGMDAWIEKGYPTTKS